MLAVDIIGVRNHMYDLVGKFLSELPAVQTIQELDDLLKPVLDHYEIQHYICTNMFGFRCLQNRKPMFGTWDSDWVSHYVSNHYYVEDAVITYSLSIREWDTPFYWSDLIAERNLTRGQNRIFDEAWDAGLKEGLVIPLPVSVDDNDMITEFAMVSLAGRKFKKDPVVKGILHLISLQAHRQARRIFLSNWRNQFAPDVFPISPNLPIELLTPRQKEVIQWLAEGKNQHDIATILRISPNTVGNHLAAARDTLQVDNNEELITKLYRHKFLI